MAMRIQLRRGTATQWSEINPILAEGEAGVDTTSHRIKFGDGINTWNNLPYSTMTSNDVYASVVDAIADDPTVIDAAAAAVDANPTIVSLTPGPGEVIVGGADGPVKVKRDSGAALRNVRARIPAADDTAVDIMFVGDSITEGQGAGSRLQRFPNQVATYLRKRYQNTTTIPGGEGYMSIKYYAPLGSAWTFTSGTYLEFGALGLGRRAHKLEAGDVLTLTRPVCTGFRLLYGKANLAGVMGVSIDGGAVTNIDCSSGGAGTVDGFSWESSVLPVGSHTLTITHVSGGFGCPEGAYVYNGDQGNKGIRVWEGGHAGFSVHDYADSTNPGFSPEWVRVAAGIQPSLFVICLGLNDYHDGVPPAQYQADLQLLISRLRVQVAPTVGFLLVAPHLREDVVSPAYPWSDYLAALYTLSADDPYVDVLDMSAKIGPGASTSASGIVGADKVHLTAVIGNAFYGAAIANHIEP